SLLCPLFSHPAHLKQKRAGRGTRRVFHFPLYRPLFSTPPGRRFRGQGIEYQPPSSSSLRAVSLPPHTQPVSSGYTLGVATGPSVDQWPKRICSSALIRSGASNQGISSPGCVPGAPLCLKSSTPFASR